MGKWIWDGNKNVKAWVTYTCGLMLVVDDLKTCVAWRIEDGLGEVFDDSDGTPVGEGIEHSVEAAKSAAVTALKDYATRLLREAEELERETI